MGLVISVELPSNTWIIGFVIAMNESVGDGRLDGVLLVRSGAGVSAAPSSWAIGEREQSDEERVMEPETEGRPRIL